MQDVRSYTDRQTLADLLKGLAVLFMIQVHLVELFATETIYKSWAGNLVLFLGAAPVAPVYMIAMGYFIARSEKSAKALIRRGVQLFLLGLLLNVALNFNLILSVSRGNLQVNVWQYIFGADILHFAGLAIIVMALLYRVPGRREYLLLFVMVLSAGVGAYLSKIRFENQTLYYVSSFLIGNSHWSYFPLFPWIAYPLAGAVLYHFSDKYNLHFPDRRQTVALTLLIPGAFIYVTWAYSVRICTQLSLYYHQSLDFFIWTIIFVMLYATCVHELDKRLGHTLLFAYFKWLGRHVTYIYVIQWIIIGNIATAVYKTVSSVPLLVLCFFIILLVASSITYSIRKWLCRKTATPAS